MSVADFFLDIDGIEGESEDLTHKKELQLLSFTRGATVPRDVDTGQAGGRRYWDDSRFTMRIDKASPQLLKSSLYNQPIKKAVLTCRKAGGADARSLQAGQEFFTITFEDAFISRWCVRGSPDADPLPLLEFSFHYAKITEEYRIQKEKGTLSGGITFSDRIAVTR